MALASLENIFPLFASAAPFLCFIVLAEGAEKGTKEEASVVASGKMVKVHYTLTVEDKVLDSSRDREPLEFRIGSRQMIPGFEKALMGMKVGEKKSFQVSPWRMYMARAPTWGRNPFCSVAWVR